MDMEHSTRGRRKGILGRGTDIRIYGVFQLLWDGWSIGNTGKTQGKNLSEALPFAQL